MTPIESASDWGGILSQGSFESHYFRMSMFDCCCSYLSEQPLCRNELLRDSLEVFVNHGRFALEPQDFLKIHSPVDRFLRLLTFEDQMNRSVETSCCMILEISSSVGLVLKR